MSVSESRKAAKEAMLHGYRHHAYENERNVLNRYLRGEGVAPQFTLTLPSYADVLAPGRERAMKNSAICFITVVCRAAIDSGLDSEYGFAISDYYINQVELTKNERELEALIRELLVNYRELILQSRDRCYSRPVAIALRYIHRNVYEPCKVAAVATAAGVHPGYLSTLFQRELQCSPSDYIMKLKLEEGKALLTKMRCSVGQTAEALGFSSSAHFSAAFKAHTGINPSAYANE